jgi:energy-coupling factor transporter ATP-binding protein EcfA2
VSARLDDRLAALREAAGLAEGRLADGDVEAARALVARAGARLGLGLESTVVALAGPTGVGKSQLFNVLAGAELAAVGRRRPTTASGQAAVWGEGGDALLDWLEIGRRHRLAANGLEGLVLLDLPDFDSIEASHRLEAERVVGLADLVLWVVEPQKYADASLHDRYLRPLATHAEAMAVVLNQADLLAAADVRAWRGDMESLLARDGLPKLPLVVVSARSGDGIAELRHLLAERVAARDAAVAKLAADLEQVVGPLAAGCEGQAHGLGRGADRGLLEALEEAAGVPTVVRAVGDAHRRRGTLATGWPFVRWLRRFRPDPVRRLRLPESPQPQVRTSLPPPTDVQRAQVASSARRLADGAAEGLPQPWPRLVREAALAGEDQVADRLDRAVAGADLSVSRPAWWRLAGLLQSVLAAAVAAGAVWLGALAVFGWLRIEDVVPLPEVEGIPIPTWLVLGGAAAGLGLALLARLVNGVGARRRERRAARSLRGRVEEVARELVLGPVGRELDVRERLCAALASARGPRSGRRQS